MSYLPSRRTIFFAIEAFFITASVATAGWMMRPPPADLDLARAKATEDGLYQVEIAPQSEPVRIGTMQAWTLTLTTPKGAPVDAAAFSVDGGMPQHGHGLPTEPRVTEALGKGRFLIEGVKFNMPGWWVLNVRVDSPKGADDVTFNLVL